MLALFGLDLVGVLEAFFDAALAGAAQAAATLEGNAALFLDGYAQQIAVLRCGDGLAVVRDESDFNHDSGIRCCRRLAGAQTGIELAEADELLKRGAGLFQRAELLEKLRRNGVADIGRSVFGEDRKSTRL